MVGAPRCPVTPRAPLTLSTPHMEAQSQLNLLGSQLSLLVLPSQKLHHGKPGVSCCDLQLEFIPIYCRKYQIVLGFNHKSFPFDHTEPFISTAGFFPLFIIQFAFCHSYVSISQWKDSMKKIISKRLLCILGYYYESCQFTL